MKLTLAQVIANEIRSMSDLDIVLGEAVRAKIAGDNTLLDGLRLLYTDFMTDEVIQEKMDEINSGVEL